MQGKRNSRKWNPLPRPLQDYHKNADVIRSKALGNTGKLYPGCAGKPYGTEEGGDLF